MDLKSLVNTLRGVSPGMIAEALYQVECDYPGLRYEIIEIMKTTQSVPHSNAWYKSPLYNGFVFIDGYDPSRRIEAIQLLKRNHDMTVMEANAFLLKGDFQKLDQEFWNGRDNAQKWLERYTSCGFVGHLSGFGEGAESFAMGC